MRSKEELKEIAKGVVSGQIFTSWSVEAGPEFPREQWQGVDITEDKLQEMEQQWEEDRDRRMMDMLKMIFLPLGLADKETIDRLKEAEAAVFFEDFSKAMPRSVNGYPIFMSMAYLNPEEAETVRDIAVKIEEAVEGV